MEIWCVLNGSACCEKYAKMLCVQYDTESRTEWSEIWALEKSFKNMHITEQNDSTCVTFVYDVIVCVCVCFVCDLYNRLRINFVARSRWVLVSSVIHMLVQKRFHNVRNETWGRCRIDSRIMGTASNTIRRNTSHDDDDADRTKFFGDRRMTQNNIKRIHRWESVVVIFRHNWMCEFRSHIGACICVDMSVFLCVFVCRF